MKIQQALATIQKELKAPKGQYNAFGKYAYRSCEDILTALKKLLEQTETVLILNDEVVNIGSRYYVKATATLSNGEETISATAYAREEEIKKGMDGFADCPLHSATPDAQAGPWRGKARQEGTYDTPRCGSAKPARLGQPTVHSPAPWPALGRRLHLVQRPVDNL